MSATPQDRVLVRLGISDGAFDRLLDRTENGLLLPLSPPGESGSCNIVIRGRPGTGKSTLALELARAICRAGKVRYPRGGESDCHYFSVYASLEHSPEAVLEQAKAFGWEKELWPIECLYCLPDRPSQEDLGKALGRIILSPRGRPCAEEDERQGKLGDGVAGPPHQWPRPGPVLLPRLSPRSLKGDAESAERLFWQRYTEIEYLLEAGTWLSSERDEGADSRPELKLVVVDSLNVFGDRPLEREQLFRLFDVFSRHGVVGVFVVEERESDEQMGISPFHYNTVEYLADIVIALEVIDAQGYLVKTIEIVKSRYQNHRSGRHPFKLLGTSDKAGQQGVIIYPSLHTHLSEVHAKEQTPTKPIRQSSATPVDGYCAGRTGDPLGYSGFRALDRMGDFHPERPSCLAVVGGRATFKSVIGKSFALRAVVCGDNALLVTLKESLELDEKHFDFSQDVLDKAVMAELVGYSWPERAEDWPTLTGLDAQRGVLGENKATKRHYRIAGHPDQHLFGTLCVMNFVPGMLLAEEFVEELLHEIGPPEDAGKGGRGKEPRITRVVIDDVATIGVSYPFLQQSPTSGSLFLTAVVDLLKSRGIDVMLIAGESQEPGCKLVADRVVALADVIIRCDFYDVFGQRYVGVKGESPGRAAGPVELNVPGVIEQVRPGERLYRVNEDLLQGLVGFETGRIERPGASLYVFQEESIAHLRYTASLRVLLQHAFGQPPEGNIREPRVSVQVFGSSDSGAVHDSLDVLGDKPIDRTVVVTVDEFWTERRRSPSLEDLTSFAFDQRYVTPKTKRARRLSPGQTAKDGRGNEALIPLPEKRIEGIPYYDNVLLLAYRRDGLKDGSKQRWSSWSHVLANAQAIMDSGSAAPPIERLFEFDSSAEETFSCAFLDLLLDAYKGDLPSELKLPLVKLLKQKRKAVSAKVGDSEVWREMDRQRGELVKRVLQEGSFAVNQRVKDFVALFGEPLAGLEDRHLQTAEVPELGPGAAVYCCWYSQLRDLIARHPALSQSLNVVPLPHGGFRGDWFLGVVKGSVSLPLGLQLIRILCSESEEYERFADGVGLPTRRQFQGKGFLAWPGGTQCKLEDVLDIHRNALSRSHIPGYRDFRYVLITLFKQLVGYQAPQRAPGSVFKSLAEQVKMMTLRPDDVAAVRS
jgi:KaiC/GvpD/RAD55 family RecA-like ATPase